jgi:hypothetical protein
LPAAGEADPETGAVPGAGWGGVAALAPLANAFARPATEPTSSPCRWRKLLKVEAADAASEADTEAGSLCMADAVWRAARFWAQVVPAVPVAVPAAGVGAGGEVVDAAVGEPIPNPGTEMPLDERLFMADWLR